MKQKKNNNNNKKKPSASLQLTFGVSDYIIISEVMREMLLCGLTLSNVLSNKGFFSHPPIVVLIVTIAQFIYLISLEIK